MNTWSVSVVTNFQKSHSIVKLAELLFVKTVFISCQENISYVHVVRKSSLWDLRSICAWAKSLTNLKSNVLSIVVKESKKVIWKCIVTNIAAKNFSNVQNAEKRWRKTFSNIILQENIRTPCLTNFWNKIMNSNNHNPGDWINQVKKEEMKQVL